MVAWLACWLSVLLAVCVVWPARWLSVLLAAWLACCPNLGSSFGVDFWVQFLGPLLGSIFGKIWHQKLLILRSSFWFQIWFHFWGPELVPLIFLIGADFWDPFLVPKNGSKSGPKIAQKGPNMGPNLAPRTGSCLAPKMGASLTTKRLQILPHQKGLNLATDKRVHIWHLQKGSRSSLQKGPDLEPKQGTTSGFVSCSL